MASSVPLAQQLPAGHPPLGGDSPKRAPIDPTQLPIGQTAAKGGGDTPSAEELLATFDATADLKTKEKTFEVALSVGKLYYVHGRFADAAEYLGQAVAKADPTRTFYLQMRQKAATAKKPVPPAGAVGCMPSQEMTFDKLSQVGRAKAKAGDAAAAASCARAALHGLAEVEALLANARFLNGDSRGALEVHERQLEVFENNPEARYGRAVLLLDTRADDVNALTTARSDLQRFLSDYPTHPRAAQAKKLFEWVDAGIAAGGVKKLVAQRAKNLAQASPTPASGNPPPLTQEMIDAVQNIERTPEVEAGFQKLVDEAEEHLAKGHFQEALDNYKRVVPFQPQNGRAQAGMAWSLVGLDRQPMAERVWMVAVSNDPAAVDKLGDTLKAKGDTSGAKKLWQKLSQSSPDYAGRLAGKLQ
ncbi:MAG: hypothetical protein ACOZIN_04690 [Myxococcota bacterium]